MAGVHALEGGWSSAVRIRHRARLPCTVAILLEPDAGNTGQNITLSRAALADGGIAPHMLNSIGNEKLLADRFDSRIQRT